MRYRSLIWAVLVCCLCAAAGAQQPRPRSGGQALQTAGGQAQAQVVPVKQAKVNLVSVDMNTGIVKVKFPNGTVSTYVGSEWTRIYKNGKSIKATEFAQHFKPGDAIVIRYWPAGPNAGKVQAVLDVPSSIILQELMGKRLPVELVKADAVARTVSVKLASGALKKWPLADPCFLVRGLKDAKLPGDPAAKGPQANVFKIGEPLLVLLTSNGTRVRALMDEFSYNGLRMEIMGLASPAPTAPKANYQPGSASRASQDIVHVTSTGTKYHRRGCRHLSKSDIAISRKDAVARGYKPCKACKP